MWKFDVLDPEEDSYTNDLSIPGMQHSGFKGPTSENYSGWQGGITVFTLCHPRDPVKSFAHI